MRFLIVFVGLLAVFGQDARELLSQGVQAYKSGRYAEAADAFQKVVNLDPTDVTARLYLATALMSQYIPGAVSPENREFAQRAKAEFREVLRLEPNNEIAINSLASLSYQEAQGMPDLSQKIPKLDEAAAWYQRALAIDPRDKEAYYSLGVIDWAKWYPAWMQARASLGMKPEEPGPLPVSAVKVDLKSQYSSMIEHGIASLEKALKIDPQYDDAMAYMNLLIRERADLRDTPEEYRRDVQQADQWIQKAMVTKQLKTQTPPPPAPPPPAPRRIRVGGNVQQANLIRKVDPVYPRAAKEAGIQGAVRFTAIIDEAGHVKTLTLVSGHPLLVDAARDAVQFWEYKPTLLNGQPIEVLTQIDVNFSLQP